MSTFKELISKARGNDAYWVGRVKFQVATQLQDLLRQNGSTQEKLAEKIGVKAPQISRALNGENNTTLESLVKMAFALGYVPQVSFVPLNSALEPAKPSVGVDVRVGKRPLADVYNFDIEDGAVASLSEVRYSSNDWRYALAA